ncbi:MAG: esterase/lipase [Polaribacter sp.]|jgi:esterase/lipase
MNRKKIKNIQRPSIGAYIKEPFRTIIERVKLNSFLKLHRSEKKGDGHPVMVIPGFMGNDRSVKSLTHFLKRNGYKAQTWGMGMNLGKFKDVDQLIKKIEKLHLETGQNISLIGWSLGGVYARELAKRKPGMIRQVITLCSPFNDMNAPNNAAWLFSLISGGAKTSNLDPEWVAKIAAPSTVPTTALFSKTDGVVAWETCIEKVEDDVHQNIEVNTSHTGVIYSQEVWSIILDRLLFQKEDWKKYSL